jgi:integrase
LSVYKDNRTGLYYIKYRNKTYRGFNKKNDALDYESRIRLNEIVEHDHITIEEVSKDFLENYKLNRCLSTYLSAKGIINKYILTFFKNMDIYSINELSCRNFKSYIANEKLSSKTKNHIMGILKLIFHHAKVFYKVKDDPTYVLEQFDKTFEEKIQEKERSKKIWTNEEFCKFISQVERSDYKLFFTVMYFTGLRIGEMQALKWSDYNDGYISVNKSYEERSELHHGTLKEPKTANSYRDVSLGKQINKLLHDYKEAQTMKYGILDPDWFIFGRIDAFHRTTINRVKKQAIEAAGVKYISNHQFRHSHASNLICNSDANIVAVSQRLGHSDTSITLHVYTHLLPKMEDKITNYIDETVISTIKEFQ